MPPTTILLLSKSHQHLMPLALPSDGSIALMTQVSGYLVAFLAAALIVAAVEALRDR
jgi:hypothetical protein